MNINGNVRIKRRIIEKLRGIPHQKCGNHSAMRFHLHGFHVVNSADDIITRKVLNGYEF